MTTTPYLVTTQIKTTGTFRDLAGVLANTSAVCTVKNPLGVASTPVVTNESTGVYSALILLDAAGRWAIEWQGTGTLIVAGDELVQARVSWVDR